MQGMGAPVCNYSKHILFRAGLILQINEQRKFSKFNPSRNLKLCNEANTNITANVLDSEGLFHLDIDSNSLSHKENWATPFEFHTPPVEETFPTFVYGTLNCSSAIRLTSSLRLQLQSCAFGACGRV